MYDELTKSDLQKMQEEIDYRVQVLRPKLIEDVQTARAFGDLSENFEYKCAKQDKNRNDARIRYLQRMIKTAKVIDDTSAADTVGLHDSGVILMENIGKQRTIRMVTTLRQARRLPWVRPSWAAVPASVSMWIWAAARDTGCRFWPSKRAKTTIPSPSAAFDGHAKHLCVTKVLRKWYRVNRR